MGRNVVVGGPSSPAKLDARWQGPEPTAPLSCQTTRLQPKGQIKTERRHRIGSGGRAIKEPDDARRGIFATVDTFKLWSRCSWIAMA
jgi:hypothetical protein